MRGLFLTRRERSKGLAWWPKKLEKLWHHLKVACRAGLSPPRHPSWPYKVYMMQAKKFQGTGVIAHWERVLPCKLGVLSSNPQLDVSGTPIL